MALALPLALYGVPYAYAAAQSTYVVLKAALVPANGDSLALVQCSNPLDSTQHFAIFESGAFDVTVKASSLANSAGGEAATGDNPNGWAIILHNPETLSQGVGVQIICQSPITVAGIGVPEFGQLYTAVAVGAVVFFLLSKHAAQRSKSARTPPVQPK